MTIRALVNAAPVPHSAGGKPGAADYVLRDGRAGRAPPLAQRPTRARGALPDLWTTGTGTGTGTTGKPVTQPVTGTDIDK